MTEAEQTSNLRDYLAAERTFLAWIRTGLALMGFGFVVARFGLFLQQLQFIQHAPTRSYGLSLWFGTALIVLGVIVNLLSAWHHLRLVRQMETGGPIPARPSTQAVFLALLLALVGVAMAIYLVSTQGGNWRPPKAEEVSMVSMANRGIAEIPSRHSVEETVERLKKTLQSKGVTLFALIDHSGEAQKVGMQMPPTKLLIFGNPKAGTPLMLAAPTVAIDLPLKILIREDGAGKVWVSYNTAEYLQERHGLPDNLLANIAIVEKLATAIAE